MRIWMASTGTPAATFYLAEDPTKTLRECACSQFRIKPKHEVQVTPLFRGSAPFIADRSNLQHTITFEVRRLWADADTAAAYILDHAAGLIWNGTLYMQGTLGAIERSMASAQIQDPNSYQTGATTFHSYTIIGGLISVVV